MTKELSFATANDHKTSPASTMALMTAAGYSRADIHMHTNLGDGWASPAQVIKEARRRGLRLIAITDHDHLEGAWRVAELLAKEQALGSDDQEETTPLELVIGVEVTTRDGHLLGLFVDKAPRAQRPVEEAIDEIKAQGGLVVVPHPFGRLVPSLSRARIEELLSKGYCIDALEMYNPSPANASQRHMVRLANQEWQLGEVGGSDAHFWQHIGVAYTLFPGQTAEELRQAILQRRATPGGQEVPTPRLPLGVYVAQCAWSWLVDPPRRAWRTRRNHQNHRGAVVR